MVYQKKLFTLIAIISTLLIGINIQFVNAEIKLDKAFLRIVYAFTQENITRESLLSRTDTMSLDIGSRYSEFYDVTAFAKDSLKKLVFQPGRVKSVSVIKNQQIAESVINVNKFGDGNVFLPNSYISFTMYKDRDEKHIYTLDKVSDMSETSIFLDEEISPQQWTIDSDTCRILDYLCYRATTKFRGREYEVFFTPEIPINEGPWKLYGLPGLILAAITSDGIFSFQAIGIQKVNDKSISIPDGKNSEVCKDLNHYQQFVQSKAKNESYTFEKNGAITIVDKFTSKNVILLEIEEN